MNQSFTTTVVLSDLISECASFGDHGPVPPPNVDENADERERTTVSRYLVFLMVIAVTAGGAGCGDSDTPAPGTTAARPASTTTTTTTAAESTIPRANQPDSEVLLAELCALLPEYMAAAQGSDGFVPFLDAVRAAGLPPAGATIVGPDAVDGTILVFAGTGGDEVVFRLRRSGMIGPASTAGQSPTEPSFRLAAGQTGYSVQAPGATEAACSMRFDEAPQPPDVTAPPASGNPRVSPTWFCVIGVAPDDTLNLRRGPGVAEPVIYEILPRACDIHRSGAETMIGGSTWVEVDVYDHLAHFRGWVNGSYIEERDNPCYHDLNECEL